jgi:hypothetical protein
VKPSDDRTKRPDIPAVAVNDSKAMETSSSACAGAEAKQSSSQHSEVKGFSFRSFAVWVLEKFLEATMPRSNR